MATDIAYTFHVRAEKHIAEDVFAKILEAEMHYDDDESSITYSQDERGYALDFYGVATDEPESELREWLTEASKDGIEIDWMMMSNDGWVYTCCRSYIRGEEIVHLDAETWINDWSEAVLVGKALDGDEDAITKIPDLILSFDGDCGGSEHLWGYLLMFTALANAGRLEARTEDVEKWAGILDAMTNPDEGDDEGECTIEVFEDLFLQIGSAIEARRLFDREVPIAQKRHAETV